MIKVDLIRFVYEYAISHHGFDNPGIAVRRIYQFLDGDVVAVLTFVDLISEVNDKLRGMMDNIAHQQHHTPYDRKFVWAYPVAENRINRERARNFKMMYNIQKEIGGLRWITK